MGGSDGRGVVGGEVWGGLNEALWWGSWYRARVASAICNSPPQYTLLPPQELNMSSVGGSAAFCFQHLLKWMDRLSLVFDRIIDCHSLTRVARETIPIHGTMRNDDDDDGGSIRDNEEEQT